MKLTTRSAILLAGVILLAAAPASTLRTQPPPLAAPAQTKWASRHRVVIQVSESDAKTMNLALNNAENLTKYYAQEGETVQIEIVAFGPGLAMVRNDISPVKDRLAALTGQMKNITVSGCGNTLATQSRLESHPITLVPQAHVVSTGIARIVELQEQGWSYVRP
jgi:intracellular sulfur oxidation DsrE/DsrF family protein